MNLSRAILSTLHYADIFDFPLTTDELYRYLIGIKTSRTTLHKTLKDLLNQKKVILDSGFLALPKRKKLIELRKSRSTSSVLKLEIARRYAHRLAMIPTVWLIGVSGALAAGNVPENDDIDFFVITAPGTLWMTRLLLNVYADILRIRRKPHETTYTDKICINMFIDGRQLEIPETEQDIYTAHEIAQLKVLVNKHQVYENFLWANKWFKDYLPNTQGKIKQQKIQTGIWPLILTPFELMAKYIQLFYMQRRRTTEVIRPAMLKFHPHDIRQTVLQKFNHRMKYLEKT